MVLMLMPVVFASREVRVPAASTEDVATTATTEGLSQEKFSQIPEPTKDDLLRLEPPTARTEADNLNKLSSSDRALALQKIATDRGTPISSSLLEDVDGDMTSADMAKVIEAMAESDNKDSARTYLADNYKNKNINFDVVNAYFDNIGSEWSAEDGDFKLAQDILSDKRYQGMDEYNAFAEQYCSAASSSSNKADSGICSFGSMDTSTLSFNRDSPDFFLVDGKEKKDSRLEEVSIAIICSTSEYSDITSTGKILYIPPSTKISLLSQQAGKMPGIATLDRIAWDKDPERWICCFFLVKFVEIAK